MKALCILAVFFTFCQLAESVPPESIKEKDILSAIIKMGRGTPLKEIHENIDIIDSSGFRAIPILLSQIENKEELTGVLQAPILVRDEKTGNSIGWRKSQIGDFAFECIRSLIEGQRSKLYGQFYILNRLNVKKWLKDRIGKDLIELRVDAAKLGLEKVKELSEKELSDDMKKNILIFEKRIDEIRKGGSPDLF